MPLNAEAVRTHLKARSWSRPGRPGAAPSGQPDVVAEVAASLDPDALFLLGLYEVALGRRPDPQGFRDNVTVLRGGVPADAVRTAVLDSDEAHGEPAEDQVDELAPDVDAMRMIGLEIAVCGDQVPHGREDRVERHRRGIPLDVIAVDLDPARTPPWPFVLATELLRWVPGAGPGDLEQAIIRVSRREAPHAVLVPHLPGRGPLALLRRHRAARRALDYSMLQLAARRDGAQVAAERPAPRPAARAATATPDRAARPDAVAELGERLARLESRADVQVVAVGDLLLGVPSREWQHVAHLAHRGHPEPGLLAAVRADVSPGTGYVEVGAGIGVYTAALAREVGPSGTVVAFEPAPVTAGVLRQNLRLNGTPADAVVRVVEAAVGEPVGSRPLAVHDEDSRQDTLYPGTGHDLLVDVEVTTLDRALPEGARVDVVKVAGAGAEAAVLRGMDRVVRENPQVVVYLDLDDAGLRRAGTSVEGLLEDAAQAGWRYELLDPVSGTRATAGASGPLAARLVRASGAGAA